jgi:hypothetical protein
MIYQTDIEEDIYVSKLNKGLNKFIAGRIYLSGPVLCVKPN